MKHKILILCIEEYLHEGLLSRELKVLSETYDIVFASYLEDALDEIAKAKLVDNDPIRGLVFQRNTLVVNTDRCRLINSFAERYFDGSLVAINMIYSDQDSEARDFAVSANYSKQDDWNRVKVILDNHFKK